MKTRQVNFKAIGTVWDIQVHGTLSSDAWTALMDKIHARIRTFDRDYSRFRADSLVTRISKKAGSYELPPDGFTMLDFYRRLYRATEGNVTPLIGRSVADAGYDASYTFQPKELHRPPSWESALSYDKNSLSVRQPVLLDFGAAGKGYLIDILSGLIEQAGVDTYFVNAGGDMIHRSARKDEIEVGLENPLDTSEAIGVVRLSNRSLCGSAGSKRAWGKFHHIIDPKSLRSPEEIIATWVIADNTMLADGLATALFFTDAASLMERFSFSYALLRKDMSLQRSADFPATIFEPA